MLSTWALIVCSLSPACFSQCSKPSRIGWFAPCIAWTRCSYVSAWSASVMQPLSCRSDVLLPPVSSGCQDEFAILGFFEAQLIPQGFGFVALLCLDGCKLAEFRVEPLLAYFQRRKALIPALF